MLHITITKDGKTEYDEDTNGFIGVTLSDGGNHAFTLLDSCKNEDALTLLWTLDTARDNLLRDHPDIGLFYRLKDLIIDSETLVDLTKIKEAADDDHI